MIKLIPFLGKYVTEADLISIDYRSGGGGVFHFLNSIVWKTFTDKTNHYPNLDNIRLFGSVIFADSLKNKIKVNLGPLFFEFQCSELSSAIIFESSSPIIRFRSNFNISTNLISTEHEFGELLPKLSNFSIDEFIIKKMSLQNIENTTNITFLEIKIYPVLSRTDLTFEVKSDSEEEEGLSSWIWNTYQTFIANKENLFKKIPIDLRSPIWIPPFLGGVLSGDFLGLSRKGKNKFTLKLRLNDKVPCLESLLSGGMNLSKNLDCAASISQLSVPVSGSVQPSVYLKILKEKVQKLILQGRNFIPTIDFVENKILKTTYPITQPFPLGIYLQYLQGQCRGAYGYDEEVNGVRVSQPIIQSGSNPNVGKMSYFDERGNPRGFVYQPGPIGKMVVDAEAETDEEEYKRGRRIKNPRKRSRRSAKKSENDWENFIYNV